METTPTDTRDRPRTSSQDVTLAILETVCAALIPLTALEVMQATGLSRATVYRNLELLENGGWIAATGLPKRYCGGLRVGELGLRALGQNRYRGRLLVHAATLCRDIQQPTFLLFYEAGFSVCTDVMHWIDGVVVPGTEVLRIPAPVTSAGKVLLAYQPPDEIERVARAGVPRFTERTKATVDEILAELELIRTRGYGLALGEWRGTDDAGLSVPVFSRDGRIVGALGFPLPSESDFQRLLDIALDCGRKASEQLGYRRPTPVA